MIVKNIQLCLCVHGNIMFPDERKSSLTRKHTSQRARRVHCWRDVCVRQSVIRLCDVCVTVFSPSNIQCGLMGKGVCVH